jgi:hypothetical protein
MINKIYNIRKNEAHYKKILNMKRLLYLKIRNKINVFLALVWGEFFLIMLDNKMGFAFTKTILSFLFIEHMNPLKCI